MMRRLVAILTAGVALAAPAAARAEYNGVPSQFAPAVELTVHRAHGDYGCSGTLVRPRLVLTAAHCVVGRRGRIIVDFADGEEFESRHVRIDPDANVAMLRSDLAVIRLYRRPHVRPLPAGVYALNTLAWSYGYGKPYLGRQHSAAYIPLDADETLLTAPAPVGGGLGGGDSGGPLVQSGRIVAVNEATYGVGAVQLFTSLDQWAWDRIAAGR